MSKSVVRQLLEIRCGDEHLAKEWLRAIAEDIHSGRPLSNRDRIGLSYALFGVLERSEAGSFWNEGAPIDQRLTRYNDPRADLDAFLAVIQAKEEDSKIELAEAKLIAAHRLGYLTDESTDPEIDAGLDKINHQRRRVKRRIDKFNKWWERRFRSTDADDVPPP